MVPLLRDWCPPLILSATNSHVLVQICLHQPSQGSRETRQKALWYCPTDNNTDKINTLSPINVFVLVIQLCFLDLWIFLFRKQFCDQAHNQRQNVNCYPTPHVFTQTKLCTKARLTPTAICWTATSELYVGCAEGFLLLVDPESLSVSVLFNPTSKQTHTLGHWGDIGRYLKSHWEYFYSSL